MGGDGLCSSSFADSFSSDSSDLYDQSDSEHSRDENITISPSVARKRIKKTKNPNSSLDRRSEENREGGKTEVSVEIHRKCRNPASWNNRT